MTKRNQPKAPVGRAPGAIASDAEVKAYAAIFREFLGPEIADHYRKIGFSAENDIRFRSVAKVCRHERESRGLSIKEASAELKAAQFRLRAIEDGSVSVVDPGVLIEYIDFLEANDWFDLWKNANPKLAKSLLSRRASKVKTAPTARKASPCRAKRIK
jgi:hypothetical protein